MFFLSDILTESSGTTTVVGPDGYRLLEVLVALLLPIVIYLFVKGVQRRKKPSEAGSKSSFLKRKRLEILLEKDRLYYPDWLKLTVRNTGSVDVDLEEPLLIFSSFWMKRKFRLKGTNNYHFYPLYLEAGKVHDLDIDLNRFYRHDRRLKRFPKVTVVISEVKGKTFPARSVMLRKTLFR